MAFGILEPPSDPQPTGTTALEEGPDGGADRSVAITMFWSVEFTLYRISEYFQ
jgi:hypothetical protein